VPADLLDTSPAATMPKTKPTSTSSTRLREQRNPRPFTTLSNTTTTTPKYFDTLSSSSNQPVSLARAEAGKSGTARGRESEGEREAKKRRESAAGKFSAPPVAPGSKPALMQA
jgi:hypothetical protein